MGAQRTPEQRQEWIAAMEARTRAAQEQLVESVTGLARGDGWRAWLDFAARLPHYSVSNQLLLSAQAEHASLVMSASEWRQVGRYPARGTTALRIWAPRRAPRADTDKTRAAEPGEIRDHPSTAGTDLSMTGADPAAGQRPESTPAPRGGTRFLLVPVFDVSQTAGEPLPQQPKPVPPPPGQAPHGMWDALADYANTAGFAVGFGDCGPADGVTDFASRSIRIAATGSPLSQALTLVHEIGHATLHADPAHRQHGAAHRGRAEVEAESVAYLVAADHGLTDALDWHFDYLAHWAAALTGPAADPDTTRAA
ncbi:MAG: zincin-like metallopeptidase domain-containing protein, partial [Propionicimonas sp.]